MSALRRHWVVLTHPHANVIFGKHVYLGPGFSLHIPGPGTFRVGDRVEFRRGFHAEISGDGSIVIGDDCRFTYNVVLQCSTSMVFEPRSIVAQASLVVDGNHKFRNSRAPMLEQGYVLRPVRIGPDAFVTSKCTVFASVGEKAVVGANSVVTRPVPAHTLAAGSPARAIEYFGPPGGEPEELRSL